MQHNGPVRIERAKELIQLFPFNEIDRALMTWLRLPDTVGFGKRMNAGILISA